MTIDEQGPGEALLASLRRVALFEGLRDSTLEEIAPLCTVHHYRGGEHLMDQDQVDQDLYLVIEGTVDIVARLPEGVLPREVVLENMDYELLGEIAWLRRRGRTATVRCHDEVQVIRIAGEPFLRYLENHPVIGFPILKRMLLAMTRKLEDSNLFLL